MNKKILLIITPIKHIENLYEKLNDQFKIYYYPNFKYSDYNKILSQVNFIFTNPNKSKVYIGKKIIQLFPNLIGICTASTGTTHLDKKLLKSKNIKIISLSNEYDVLKKISSTAELAVSFSLMGVRKIYESVESVKKNEWNYEKFIGRQLDNIKIGVVGYGRLGKIYSKLMLSFGSRVTVYDPYKKVNQKKIFKTNSLIKLFKNNDIVSLHVHANNETKHMVNKKILAKANKDLVLINTSRGEVINEKELCSFLSKNSNSKAYLDVLEDEINSKFNSPLFKYFKKQKKTQIIITPHIGGMTKEAQKIAYTHSAKLLITFLKNNEKTT